jgi:hypothetical protein
LEKIARDFYNTFKLTSWHELSRHYLRLTQKLTPLRIACSGGQVPLDDVSDDGAEDEAHDDEEGGGKPKGKKPVQFSDFAFKSKLQTLVSELQRVRDEDSTGKQLPGVILLTLSSNVLV